MEWWIILTEQKLVDDLRKAPEHILSASRTLEEVSRLTKEIRNKATDTKYPIILLRKFNPGIHLEYTSRIIRTTLQLSGLKLPGHCPNWCQSYMLRWLAPSINSFQPLKVFTFLSLLNGRQLYDIIRLDGGQSPGHHEENRCTTERPYFRRTTIE